MPGVTITVTNVDTGLERVQVIRRGRTLSRVWTSRRVNTRVKAELQGFAPVRRTDLTVAIGKDLLVDVDMKVGGLTEQVTVAGETSSVSLGTTTAGGVVTTQQIAELPLNGRSFMQLATLQPGVIVSRATARDFTGGFGNTQLAIGGARPEQTGYLMDGTNIADISDKAPSSLSGVLLGVDTVQEFSVQTHGYSAEFGRAAGGIMSTVTKSGTNQIRGTRLRVPPRRVARLARTSSRRAICPTSSATSSAARSAARSCKNRLFYFGALRGAARAQRGHAIRAAAQRRGASGHPAERAGQLVNVGVHPTARPYLDLLFPIPDGQDFGDGTAELAHSHQDPTDEHFGVVKFDYNIGKRRQHADGALVARRFGHEHLAGAPAVLRAGRHRHALLHDAVPARSSASSLMNTLRFAANRTGRDNDLIPTVDIPTSLYFTEDPHWGAINITNISTAGSVATIPVDYKQDLYQVSDTLTWTKGSHVRQGRLRLAELPLRRHSRTRATAASSGSARYGIPDAQPQRDRAGRPLHRQPARHRHVPADAPALRRRCSRRTTGASTNNLSVNYGLRYEFVTTRRRRTGRSRGF